jgi:hypothetical protein
MDEFDLDRLTDHDFEHLCKDLFEEQLGLPLEIFSVGADDGIDLKYETGDQLLVIQCKHYTRAGRAGLLRRYRASEASTVKALSPTRYVIATSAELNPRAKRELQTMLQPVSLASGDIYGVTELAALLRAKPHVVSRHLRLWLGSSSELIRVIHRDVARRSTRLAKEIDRSLKLYVPDASYEIGRQILEEQHCCIISGTPGAGKTMLARALCATYLQQGYALVDASMALQDLDRVWEDGGRQIFFVDDFLGQATLDDQRADSASRVLLQLFRDARDDPDKRIVLTTRDYVLARAREYSDRLRHQNFTPVQCVVEVGGYSRRDRATILYNHLYFSSLSPEQRNAFADHEVFTRIVDHPSFSPRILEHVLSGPFGHGERTVVDELGENLTNPTRIWSHLVEEVFTPAEVAAAVVLYTLDGHEMLDNFRADWSAYLSLPDDPESARTFLRVIRRLDGTILSTSNDYGRIRIGVRDPSVIDYMAGYVAQRPEVVRTILRTATSTHQVEYLWRSALTEHPRRGRHSVSPEVNAAMRATLRAEVDDLAAAVHRLWRHSRPFIGNFVDRAPADDTSLAVIMADEFRAPSMVDVAVKALDSVRSWGPKSQGRKLVDLVVRLQATRVPDLRQRLGLVMIETIKVIRADVDDWDSRESALELLERLGNLAPPDLVEEISVQQDEEAESVLSDWYDVDEPDFDFDENNLERTVEWVENRGDESVTGYQEAQAYLNRQRTRFARTARFPTGPATHRPVRGADPRQIDDIVDSVGRGPKPE